MSVDVVVVGGGILGLATALAVTERDPDATVAVLEKEASWAHHQTGNNSGVIHSGIYYKPGSFKARFCRQGNAALQAFCDEHDIDYQICGKLIVATETDELGRLDDLHQRAIAHGLEVERLGPEGIRQHEPHAAGIAALWVPSTGIVDYTLVTETYARLLTERGATLRLGTRVTGIRPAGQETVVDTEVGPVMARFVVNCAGLHSDRVAKLAGADPEARIVPFRGEYFELAPARRHLVQGLIYPVPDPAFPFLGVHLTRMIDGTVHAGPNAVLALKREGYTKAAISLTDTLDTLSYPGFWRLARRHARTGAAEVVRSFSRARFAQSLQRLVPEVQADDLVPTHAGVRAQALRADGSLVDDFLIVDGPRSMHVCNAPSPAATSSLEIGRHVARAMPSLEEIRGQVAS